MMDYLPIDYSSSLIKDYVSRFSYSWEMIVSLSLIIKEEINKLQKEDFVVKDNNIYIHKDAEVNETATIIGPCIIFKGVKVLPNAYIRENVILEKNCFVGHSCEIKNSFIMEGAIIAHFNYVGDSIIGHHSHLGAGAIISNYRLDHKEIIIDKINTKTDKIGAIIGEFCEIGSNSVINPGSIIYPHKHILPLSSIRGINR